MRVSLYWLFPFLISASFGHATSSGFPKSWGEQWPRTDFSRATIDLHEIRSGGPGKDGIPAIDNPRFVSAADRSNLADDEPVIGLVIGEEAKAYSLRVLMWHEIVNDVAGGIPVTVTYCPLCNTSIVFDRRVDGRVLDFGTTGNLRHSDLVMYDRQTESWWQQYGGAAIAGALAGKRLQTIPSRLESLAEFRRRAPAGLVLVPNDPTARDYGANPYVGYDRAAYPFMYGGKLPADIPPMMRVVAVDDIAFALPLLLERGSIEQKGIRASWRAGQRSALDSERIALGRDVGNVVVTRNGQDIGYVVTFAFAFFAFHPDGTLFTRDGQMTINR